MEKIMPKKPLKKPEYSKQDLKDLVGFLEGYKQHLQDNNKGEIWFNIETLIKFLKATYYDTMLFEDWIDNQTDFADVFLYPREDIPLLVQGDNELRDILVKYRLSKNI